MRSPAEPLRLAAAASLMLALGSAGATAADLAIASVHAGRAGSRKLFVSFKTPVPAAADVQGKNVWEVHAFAAGRDDLVSVDDAVVESPADYPVTGLVTLLLAAPLPAGSDRIEVRYKRANFPLAILTSPKPSPASAGIKPVDDPKKADVYLSGILLPGAGEKPVYTIDSSGNYQFWRGGPSESSSWDLRGSAKADKRPRADLDSFLFGGSFQHVGGKVNVRWFQGIEMDRKARVVNLATAPEVIRPWTHHVIRPRDDIRTLIATLGLTFDGSIETGLNMRNAYDDPENALPGGGSGWFLRFVPAATLYAVKPKAKFFDRISVMARYGVRLLVRDELFLETRKSRGVVKDPIPQMNRRARHAASATATFMLSPFAGVELKYQYGSEPPAFKFADHGGSVGLVIKFQQTDRTR